jgi:hypothetical protein
MTRSAAEIEADVEASRSDLDRNVEALRQKMTPGQLFDEAARMMGGTGQQVASKFADQAKANPMPLAVMGLGLAWLMMSHNQSGASGGGRSMTGESRSFADAGLIYEEGGVPGDSLGDKAHGLADKAHGLADKAQDMLSGARDKLGSATSAVGDSRRSAIDSLSSAAGAAREKVGQVGQQAQRTFVDTLESEPLLIAGIGLLVGAAIGAALPSTPTEDRLMGDARDKVLTKGKDLAQSGLEQAGAAAQAAYGGVKSELQTTDDSRALSERVEGAAKSGVQAARDQLQGPAH